MIYRVDFDRFGRFVSVPSSVVDKYIRIADGNYIKVLLCVFASESREVDSALLAEQTGLKESIVCDAMLFWTEIGLIRTDDTPVRENSPEPLHEIKNVPAPEPVPETKKAVRYSPKELANKVEENSDIKYLVGEFEKVKGTPIKDNEIMGLINLTEYYGFDAQSLMLIIEYCHLLGKDSIGYIEKVAKDWFSKDITDYSDVEEEIIRQTKMRSYESKAARAFGLSRKLSKNEKEFFNSWQNMGFSIEMLEIAYDKCIDSKKELNFNYINGILQRWAGENIRTPEQVEQNDTAYTKSKPKYNANKKTSYDLDEWDKFADNFIHNLKRGAEND